MDDADITRLVAPALLTVSLVACGHYLADPRTAARGAWIYNNWDFNAVSAAYEQSMGESIFAGFARRIATPLCITPLCITPLCMEDFRIGHGRRQFARGLFLHKRSRFPGDVRRRRTHTLFPTRRTRSAHPFDSGRA